MWIHNAQTPTSGTYGDQLHENIVELLTVFIAGNQGVHSYLFL